MRKYIVKFNSANAANNYTIVDIPFTTTVVGGTPTNLVCNEENKKISVDGQGNISIVNASPIVPNDEIHYTATSQVTPYDETVFGATYLSSESEFDETTGEGILKFDGDVTSIGKNAFYICRSLTAVTIPNSVTNIGSNAFSYCSSLASVTIPNSVTSIGDGIFSWCGITSVIISNNVTSITEGAFEGCRNLSSIEIPNSVTSIGWAAFSDCSGLTSVTIPNSVTSIAGVAFQGCSNLTSIEIPNSVTSIEYNAFMCGDGLYDGSLQTITVGENVFTYDGESQYFEITLGNGVGIAFTMYTAGGGSND